MNMCEITMKEYKINRESAEAIMQLPVMSAIIVLVETDEKNKNMEGDEKCID